MPVKQEKPILQISIISLSAFLVVGASIFFLKGAGDLMKADVFESTLTKEIEKVAVPVSYETRIAKGDALFDAGYYSLALAEYAFAVSIQDENPEAHMKLGHTYMKLKDYQAAALEYKILKDRNQDDTVAQTYYGIALIRSKDFEGAQSVFDGFTKEVQEAQYYGALLDSLFGRFSDAQKKLSKASELEGSTPQNNIDIFQTAYKAFDSVKEGQDVYLQTLLAKAMIDTGEFQLAEALALDVLSVKSDYRDAWIIFGYSKLKTEAYQDAEDAFIEAKKLDAIKPETHYFLATSHYFQEEYQEAVTEYELALLYGFKPEIEAYEKIAESQLFMENYEDALAAYEHLVKIDGTNVSLFVRPVWIAITYVKDLNRALSLSEQALEAFPMDAMSHNLMAWSYLEMNELDKADEEISRAFMLDPNLAAAHLSAGMLREKQGNPDGAKLEYKKAYDLAESGDSISNLAAENFNALINDEQNLNPTLE